MNDQEQDTDRKPQARAPGKTQSTYRHITAPASKKMKDTGTPEKTSRFSDEELGSGLLQPPSSIYAISDEPAPKGSSPSKPIAIRPSPDKPNRNGPTKQDDAWEQDEELYSAFQLQNGRNGEGMGPYYVQPLPRGKSSSPEIFPMEDDEVKDPKKPNDK